MARGTRYLSFEGQFESSVLGTFRIIRGFANLKDLAEISVPYTMESDGKNSAVKGQQRQLDTTHAERIKNYLENGERRFLPEVILSIRTDLTEIKDESSFTIGISSNTDNGIGIDRRWKSKNIKVHRVWVDRNKLTDIRENKLIRRVDGNHRLALADQLKDDPHLLTKYLSPFCFILLNPAGDASDDYSESLIFHTINSNALPLESEHALKLILGQNSDFDMKPENEFAFSPDLHFTRLLRDGLKKLPAPVQTRLGDRPLTSLRGAVRGLLDTDPTVTKDLPTLEKYSKSFLDALNDIVTRLEPSHPALCRAEFFFEIVARIWKQTPENQDHNEKVNEVVSHLEQLAGWLGKDGLLELREGQSLSKQIIDIYSVVRSRVPKRVFLARWYPTANDGDEFERGKLRLKYIKQALKEIEKEDGAHLDLIDMGSRTGSTFPIHEKMYQAILSADIILVDLSGVRPNVCVEAGYALRNHEKNRLIFIFQPTKLHTKPPFDLDTYRYEPFTDTGEIPDKIKPHIKTILREATVGI